MRSPIQDANAGAATDVAPTKKHAVRTATIAQNHGNQAQERAKQINQAASGLGQALGNFMEEKRTTELEQRYTKAFHEQGTKTGMSEYQKDLKRSGFTEFIYGGQSPEYQGALDASARNASNAMYVEEAEFAEGAGADMTPEQYQKYLQDKVTAYNKENFADAPDAAFAFMKNWKDNSNELSRQQIKNYQVREQEKARATVAEGFQTDFDVYKTMVDKNPDKAAELGREMFTGKYKPKGMSDEAYRGVLVDESMTAIRAHDYSALKLLNESGLVSTFNDKELKEYETVRKVIDEDNFNMLEAARLDYETVVENPASSSEEIRNAQARMNSAIQQLAARNTGSTKHLKTVYGADRHRGVLNNQWMKRVEDETIERNKRLSDAEKAATKANVERVVMNESNFEVDLYAADPKDKRVMLADRLDNLLVARATPDLDPEVREKVNTQYVKYKKMLDKYDTAQAAANDKANAAALKKEKEEAELATGVESLVTGGGHVAVDSATRQGHIKGAVDSVVNQIIPDTTVSSIDKLEQIVGNPTSIYKFIKGTGNFQSYVKDSKELNTAVQNLATNLRAELTEDNTYTQAQRDNAASLEVLKQQAPEVYNNAFSADERVQIAYLQRAIAQGKGVAETVRTLDTVLQNVDTATAFKANGEDVVNDTGVAGAPADVQNAVYAEYKAHLPLGHDAAMSAARTFAQGINTKAGGTTVRYGSTFKAINGRNLNDTMNVLSKTYRSGGVTKSGYTRALSALVGGSKDANGRELYSLKQVPDVKVSVFQGGIMLELHGRVQMIQRPELEAEMNGYDEWYRGTDSIRPKSIFSGWNW